MLDQDIRQAVAHVQQGHDDVREKLLKEYQPFVLKVTSKFCKRYVQLGVDDEASIALIAFNEALDKYRGEYNASFLIFAQTVIKRRMIDYFRKQEQGNREIPWSSIGREEAQREENGQFEKITWKTSYDQYIEEDINQLRRAEIVEFQTELRKYGISMQDLIKVSPKHQDARVNAYKVARIICNNELYSKYLLETKGLPLKHLEKEVNVSRKTLERQRKYIIALSIIILGRYYFLEEYLEGLKG